MRWPVSSATPTKAELLREVESLRARVAELDRVAAGREQAGEAFEESRAAFAAVFQTAPVMMMMVGSDLRVRAINRAAESVVARSAEATKGRRFGNAVRCIYSLEDPKGCGYGSSCETCPLRRVVLDTFETKQAQHQVEVELTFGDAQERHHKHLLVSTSLVDLSQDHWVLVCARDITERKRAEQSLRDAHEILERLFAATHVCIAYMDTDFNFIRVNRAYAEADGRTPEFFVGKNHFDLYPHQENQAIFRRAVMLGEPCSFHGKPFEYTEHPERGVTYWDWSLHPVKDAAGRVDGVLLCLVDATKRVQAEKLARERRAALAHVSRISTIVEMASGLAHELTQPLGAVCTYADACGKMLEAGSLTDLAGTVDKMAGQARRAAQIVSRIRGFVGKTEPHRDTVDLNSLVKETVGLAEKEVKAARVTVSLALSEQVPLVQADSVQIQQLMVNLVRNGIDAIQQTTDGPRALTIQSTSHPDGAVGIAVCDTGIGLGDEVSQRMFEPFFTTKPGGLGLGLLISRSIAEAHGGRLWATPNPARGTIFHLTLPVSGEPGNVRC